MDCQKFQEYLYPYLDGELAEDLRLEMQTHQSNCPVCALELEKEQRFGHIVKNHFIKEHAPFTLREAVVKQLEKKQNQFSISRALNFKTAWGVVIITLLIAAAAFQRGTMAKPFPVFDEVTQKHLEYLRGVYPLEFKTGELKEALAWFSGKTDFAVTVPHIALNKVNVVGGRMINLKDKKSAYILLEKDGYKISCFYADLNDVKLPGLSVKDGVRAFDDHRLVKTQQGYNTIFCYHRADGTACIFVSDMPMDQFAKLFV